MASYYQSPEDIVNAALSELGYMRRIGDLNEGSPAARVFLDLYGQARDEELIVGMGTMTDGRPAPWQFSVARKLLSGYTKSATTAYPGTWNSATQPPPPWQYEWSLPSDYLKALDVQITPTSPGIQYDPKPQRWEIIDDNQSNANGSRALVTMTASPILVYIAQMLDPTTWDQGYTANLIANLKRKAVLALKQEPQLLGPEAQIEAAVSRESGAIQP